MALFGKACSKLADLWNATDCSTYEDECSNHTREDLGHDTLEGLSGAGLRSAARSFSPSTSATYDGIHPRQLDCLSDEALDTLAVFLNLVEDLGAWPPGIAAVISTLIPKPKGGTRPIGMFPGIYRCWARARGSYASNWEREHDRAYFAAKGGNSALDTVWDQAFRSERAVTGGKSAAAVLLDMRSFYEHFCNSRLEQRAKDSGFSSKIERLALAAYAAPRLITHEGKISAPLRPWRQLQR